MRHKTRTWTRSPKGVPAVMGKTQGERAKLIRYSMAGDNKVQFAIKFLGVSPAIWSMIENDKRMISLDMMKLILRVVPQVSYEYIDHGAKDKLGERFLNIVIEAQAKASGLSQ